MFLILIAALLALNASLVTADFTPGCSFVGGSCQYSVTLGHAGQCDSVTVPSSGGGTSGDTSCCNALDSDITTIRSDIDLLRSQVTGLMNDLTKARSDLVQAQTTVNQTEIERDALLSTLQQKEAELRTTQTDLANILRRSSEQITALRAELANMTAQASSCRTAMGLPTTIPSASLMRDANLLYCNFSSLSTSECKFTITSKTEFLLMSKGHSTSTGPRSDHTRGSTGGLYLGLDGSKVARKYTSSATRQFTADSQELSPASAYCIFFHYSMVGYDVVGLDLNVKIGGGVGYPVWNKAGEQTGDWNLAQVELDSEYTANSFQLQFVAKSDAYTRYSSSIYNAQGDIGIDDLYVYNTTCNNVAKCPPTSTQQVTENNITSCYSFHTEKRSWVEAYDICRREGPWSALVSIESAKEQEFLVKAINNLGLTTAGQFGFYTSGNDLMSEHQFAWSDTGKARPVDKLYTNWHANQPNNVAGNQDCLLMEYASDGYSWGDVNCDSAHPFICESRFPA